MCAHVHAQKLKYIGTHTSDLYTYGMQPSAYYLYMKSTPELSDSLFVKQMSK